MTPGQQDTFAANTMDRLRIFEACVRSRIEGLERRLSEIENAGVNQSKQIKEIKRALGYVNKDIVALYRKDSSYVSK